MEVHNYNYLQIKLVVKSQGDQRRRKDFQKWGAYPHMGEIITTPGTGRESEFQKIGLILILVNLIMQNVQPVQKN